MQTMSLDALLEMGRTGDIGRFFQIGHGALMQGCDTDALRLLLMQRLLERGLVYRARAYAEGLSEEVRSHPDFAGMWQKLSSNEHNGLIPLSSLSPRFEANMTLLRKRYPWAGAVAETWNEVGPQIEFHLTAEGRTLVFDGRNQPDAGWKPSFNNHEPPKPLEAMKADLKGQLRAAFAIEGVGLGYYLPWLYEASADTFLGGSTKIYQLEPSYLALAVAMHICDWREVLADERVIVCCGPDVNEQLSRLAKADRWNAPPISSIRSVPWNNGAAEAVHAQIERLHQEAETERISLQTSLSERYRGRDTAWWQRRYEEAASGEGPPLRILTITSRFTTVLQYSMRDAVHAFQRLGCKARMLIEPTHYDRLTQQRKLEEIRDFEPDMIFMIDHTRLSQHQGLIPEIPVVTWIQDRLEWLFSKESGASMGPLDFCIGFCRDELVEQFDYPAERFLKCEMVTSSASLQGFSHMASSTTAGEAPVDVDPRYACDVAFATNYSERADGFFKAHAEHTPGTIPLLEAIRNELETMAQRGKLTGALNVRHLIRRVMDRLGITVAPQNETRLLQEYVIPLADRFLRLQTLDWIVGWAERTGSRFHLYGNGWDKHPRYGKYAKGFLEHGPELGRAFRSAKINIHASMNWALHQRVLDGLAAGGFFLMRTHANDLHWSRFHHAFRDLILRRGLKAGDIIDIQDIPPELRETWAADREMRGLDADTPYAVGDLSMYDEVGTCDATNIRSPLQIWPDYEQVIFNTREQLEDRLAFFLDHEDERRALAGSMRGGVEEAFSYRVLLKRLLSWMTAGLGSQT